MEVPSLGVKSEMQLLAYPTAQQCQIQAASATYTTVCGNAASQTHWARLGVKPASSWILVGFVTAVPQWELLRGCCLVGDFSSRKDLQAKENV